MKIRVSRIFRNAVENNLYKGVKEYMLLHQHRKEEILMQVFQRALLLFWFSSGERSTWSRVKRGSKKDDMTQAVLDNELLSSEIVLNSKAVDKEEKMVPAPFNVPVTDERGKNVPGKFQTVTRETKVVEKTPKASARVLCTFDAAKSELTVKVLEVTAKDDKTRKNYLQALNKELEDAKSMMEYFFTMEQFLKCFYDTLHSNSLTMTTGMEAVYMYRVFKNAIKYYPQFEKLNDKERAEVLDQGYRRARGQRGGLKDTHTYAKGTFEAFAANGLINEVLIEDQIFGKLTRHTKVGENRKDRCNPDNSREVWEKNALIFVVYTYGSHGLTTSIHASELWNLMARSDRDKVINAW